MTAIPRATASSAFAADAGTGRRCRRGQHGGADDAPCRPRSPPRSARRRARGRRRSRSFPIARASGLDRGAECATDRGGGRQGAQLPYALRAGTYRRVPAKQERGRERGGGGRQRAADDELGGGVVARRDDADGERGRGDRAGPAARRRAGAATPRSDAGRRARPRPSSTPWGCSHQVHSAAAAHSATTRTDGPYARTPRRAADGGSAAVLAFDIDMTSANESSGPGGGSARRYQAPSPGSAVAEGREAEAWSW